MQAHPEEENVIEVTSNLSIDESELQFDFVRASGPGGQNVNKVASAVQLRFDLRNSPSLTDPMRRRAAKLAGNRLTNDGEIIITASNSRSQKRNREKAVDLLVDLLREAARPPKIRRKTRPTAASKRRRLENKRRRGEAKKRRGSVKWDGA